MSCEDIAAELAEIREPGTQISRKLLVDFAAEPLCEGWTFAGGRDGDLEIAAAYDGSKEEIAVGDIVDRVAEDVTVERALVNGGVHFGIVCRGDDEEVAIEICEIERTFDPFQLALGGKKADLFVGFGGDNAKTDTGFEKTADLVERDSACPDQQAGAAVEL